MSPSRLVPLAAVAVLLSACTDDAVQPAQEEPVRTMRFSQEAAGGDAAAQVSAWMDAVNADLEAAGAPYRTVTAELILGGAQAGATVIQKDLGNKRIPTSDFVPNDPRRVWSGPDNTITYVIDQVDAVPLSPGLNAAATTAAIEAAMGTWDAVRCSDLGLTRVPDLGIDFGIVAALNGLGGSFSVAADIMHTGFSDLDFDDGVIGATFLFIFAPGNVPTDIDGNGLGDAAFREIYYDPSWLWTVGDFPGVDVESIALHEAGHGLSQAHFGNLFVKKGELSASPRAVMNAAYQGPLRTLLGTDRGGHCGNWAQWPNR